MKINIYILLGIITLFAASCSNPEQNKNAYQENPQAPDPYDHGQEVHFSEQKFESLDMKVDTLRKRNMGSYVEVNGQLEVPPQNEATVTAIIGANITKIMVIEGEKVAKGEVLAYISHPDLIQLQTDYANKWNELQFLEQEYNRQKKLYEEKVGSGKEFQKAKADYQSMKSTVNGLTAQLRLLHLSAETIKDGNIIEQIGIRSPIKGYVRLVEIKTGQYVSPQTELFEIVNIDHIHADLMVFEKDIHKVHEGQKVRFRLEATGEVELEAEIYTVGKNFESDPKAIHLHAEIENKIGLLLPGMYVRGEILINNVSTYALPESAVVREGEKYFIFTATAKNSEWVFQPIEIKTGIKDDGWIEIKFLNPFDSKTQLAWSNAYYLIAELKKSENEHSH